MTSAVPTRSSWWINPLRISLSLISLLTLAYWGGVPRQNQALFWLGIAAFMVMIAAVLTLAWVLLKKPISGLQQASATLSLSQRRLIAWGLIISSLNIIIGGFWDEVWHRRYGIPFGEDFFWRPHLMLYLGLTLVVVLAVASLFLLRQQPGSWLARLRANPSICYLCLLALMLLYVIPADPFWHYIYGQDITAWSLPHIVLVVCFSLISISGVAILLSTLPTRDWQAWKLSSSDILMIVAFALALTIFLQIMTTEWDSLSRVREGSRSAFWRRPVWVLPVVLSFAASFIGSLALFTSYRVGTASFVAALAFALRFSLIQAFDVPALSSSAWLICLLVLIAIDLAALIELRRGHTPRWQTAALAAFVVMSSLGLYTMSKLFIYPAVTVERLPMMLLGIGLSAVFACWTASHLGLSLQGSSGSVQPESIRLAWLSPLGLGLMLGFIVLFIMTATPPLG